MSQRTIVLIDGEHYPSVSARAIKHLRAEGFEPIVALVVGGKEKLGQVELDVGVPVELAGDDAEGALAAVIERTDCRHVFDLSDEPVLGYLARSRLASVALFKGATYEGPGFRFDPRPMEKVPGVPTVALIGTGKRTGKTAVGGHVARLWSDQGLDPVVIAMGRGGPEKPEVIDAPDQIDSDFLLELVKDGKHASSDYLEDALTARVRTVGAYRAGGGFSGEPALSNVQAAVAEALKLRPGILLLEGSGAAMPPVEADATILIVDATTDVAFIEGYFGLYRILLADLIVLTMCEDSIDRENLSRVERCISGHLQRPQVVHTVLRPYPLGDVSGKRIFFVTTASDRAADAIKAHMQDEHGAEVVGMSHALADREKLKADLEGMPDVDSIVVELKAAAVDVVTRVGAEKDVEVIYVDNRPVAAEGFDDPVAIDDALLAVGRLAIERQQG